MNTNRTSTRLMSLALAALVTVSVLAGIDALAGNEQPALDLMARVASLAQPA